MRTKVRTGLLVLMALALVTVGCTRRYYRDGADQEVSEVLTEKNRFPQWGIENFHVYPDPRARFADPTNPDRPPMPPDDPAAWDLSPHPQKPPKHAGIRQIEGFGYLDYLAACTSANRAEEAARLKDQPKMPPARNGAVETAEPPQNPDQGNKPSGSSEPAKAPESSPPQSVQCPPYKLKLEQAVELGLFNSREYQDARENLYLTALPVTLERFAFSSQFLAAGELIRRWTGSELNGGQAGNLWLADSTLGFSKLFPTGALLLFRLANTLTINLNHTDPKVVATGDAALELAQPLLRGGGKAVTLEPLTLAERNLLYGIRDYARFRKQFYVAIAGGGDFIQPSSGTAGGALLTASNPFATGRGIASLDTIFPGSAGIILPGRSVQLDGAAPTQGYLPTILQASFVENDRQNIDQLRRFLKQFQALAEGGGDVSTLQVGQIEQQLLRGQSQLLQDELNYRNGIDFFKLQLGIPTEVPLELDGSVLRPMQEHVNRFQEVINQADDIRFEVQGGLTRTGVTQPGYGRPGEVRLLRGRLRRLFTDSPLTRGTPFSRTILDRWARWEKNTPEGRAAALQQLVEERRRLEAAQEKAEAENRSFPAEQAQRLEDVRNEIDLGSFEQSLSLYESRAWERPQPGARNVPSPEEQVRLQAGLFRQVFNTFVQVITQAREERLNRLRESWPSLPRIAVNGVDLIQADLEQAQATAGQIALSNRFDLLNARAELVDYWRQIAVQANSLLGVLNIRYNLDSFTPPGKDQPFSFSGSRTRHDITLNGELPLVRKLERNNYRAALIAYQRERRVVQATEDFILADVRSELRQLRVLAENFRIQQRQLELGITQVEASLDAFNQPSLPAQGTTIGTVAIGGTTGSSGTGNAAALTQQLINAQSSLLQAQNALYQVWINYLVFRLQLYRDLELMPLDPRGVWIDEPASLSDPRHHSDASGRAATGPGRDPGPAPERLPEPRPEPDGGRPGQPAPAPQPAPPGRP